MWETPWQAMSLEWGSGHAWGNQGDSPVPNVVEVGLFLGNWKNSPLRSLLPQKALKAVRPKAGAVPKKSSRLPGPPWARPSLPSTPAPLPYPALGVETPACHWHQPGPVHDHPPPSYFPGPSPIDRSPRIWRNSRQMVKRMELIKFEKLRPVTPLNFFQYHWQKHISPMSDLPQL